MELVEAAGALRVTARVQMLGMQMPRMLVCACDPAVDKVR